MSGSRLPLPRLFVAMSGRRALVVLGALALLFGAAMLPALATMSAHGASAFEFETAGTVARSQEILGEWGDAGERAMWWQLALDTPFAVCYGLLLAGGCAAIARRAQRLGNARLEGAAAIFAWLGAIAAVADLAQDIALAVVLAGSTSQPWPAISSLAVPVTLGLGAATAAFALGAALATRERSVATPV